jgi:hypothetical protein
MKHLTPTRNSNFDPRFSTADVSLPRGSRTVPVPQLLASNSNGSRGLNRGSTLTHSPTNSLHSTVLIALQSTHSLCTLGKDRKENTASNSSSIVACVYTCMLRPFHSNGPCLQINYPYMLQYKYFS